MPADGDRWREENWWRKICCFSSSNHFYMDASVSAPLLTRVKSWQLVGLGLTGWCTLYSIALLTCGPVSFIVGNAQGGCFAASMTLAGLEVRRYKKAVAAVVDPFTGVTVEMLNQAIALMARKQAFRIEPMHPTHAQLGFGVRAVTTGRTLVFETSRWREPVIDLAHVQDTEENRKKASANLAVIVSAGAPDENAMAFVVTHPIQFLAGKELEGMLGADASKTKDA